MRTAHEQRANNARTTREQRANNARTAYEQRTNNECELVRTTRELRANYEPGISYSIGTGTGTYGGARSLGMGGNRVHVLSPPLALAP